MNAESVKARLKNVAKDTGRTFQDLLMSYGMERTLYRLSVSDYREKFTLKDGFFLYALYDGDYPRATTDIDYLAKGISNDRGTTMHTIVAFSEEYSDGEMRLSRWKSFAKKKKISLDVSLVEAIEAIKSFYHL